MGQEIPVYDQKYAGLNVLIVDDTEANVIVLENFLKKYGCQVTSTSTGRGSIEAMKSKPSDIIFMDCHMPDMDGFAATRAIRVLETGLNPSIIIALTADVRPGYDELCLEAGMDDYLTIPISLDRVFEALEKWKPRVGIG